MNIRLLLITLLFSVLSIFTASCGANKQTSSSICDTNPCKDSPIPHKTVCIENGNDFTCECEEGYKLFNGACKLKEVNPCEPNPCTDEHKTICKATGTMVGDYDCKCNTGYLETPDKLKCLEATGVCGTDACGEYGECVSDNDGNLTCSCNDYFQDTTDSLVCLGVNNEIKINENSPIIIYGDTRTNYNIHKKVVESFLEKKPSIVFNTGDLVYDGNNVELWPKFYEIIKPILKIARYYPVLGNHEKESINYFKLFDLPNNEKWYNIDIKNIRFFILDSNSTLSKNSRQYNWLKDKLASTEQYYKILIFHHPLYSVGRHGGRIYLRNELMELIKEYNIKLVFNGHDHAYERLFKDGVNYIVTGGGGAPLYDENKNSSDERYLKKYIKKYHYCLLKTSQNELSLEVYDLNNKLIDNITIQ